MRPVSSRPPGDLAFRAATDSAADVAAVVELVESAYRGEPSRAGWTTEADLVAGQRTSAAEVRTALTDPHSTVLLAVEDTGALVGCCHVERRLAPADHPARSGDPGAQTGDAGGQQGDPGVGARRDTGRDAPETAAVGAYFGMFAVRPTRQSGGVGAALLGTAERHAVTTWGAGWMELLVIAQRGELIDWYRRRGYLSTSRTRPFPYNDRRFGEPLRPDLYFVVLRRTLT
ncbi:Acetyltransferase [Frankia canadensis]|uniref:Acetyltransferase n=1 Tax=Frankia canadensis TaxID=1836972 RepID=A0A2I2L0Z7_9ACTN|nr:GNAT family N-acetyltransferase [Frankia canadensis]SNQ51580.1 Acetyltransferase [Frankia canadensis]SOU58870.1 Acetyltransferase [Frankia canadensis]